jgi:hypothetical protein
VISDPLFLVTGGYPKNQNICLGYLTNYQEWYLMDINVGDI